MPVYEYRCEKCGRITSFLVRSGTARELSCEACGSSELTRQVSRPAIIRSRGGSEAGSLRPVDPREAIRQMSDMYENSGADVGRGFRDVVSRVEAGDSPNELREAVKEARQKESAQGPSQG